MIKTKNQQRQQLLACLTEAVTACTSGTVGADGCCSNEAQTPTAQLVEQWWDTVDMPSTSTCSLQQEAVVRGDTPCLPICVLADVDNVIVHHILRQPVVQVLHVACQPL